MRAHISCTTISARVTGDHGPQQEKSILRAGLGVGQDAAGIVVDVRGDDPRPDYSEEQQRPASPASPKLHAHISPT